MHSLFSTAPGDVQNPNKAESFDNILRKLVKLVN